MEDNRIIECIERAHYILSNLMAVKPGEEVLIAIDPQTDMRMANAMAAAALMCGAEYNVSMMPIRGKDRATILPEDTGAGDGGLRCIRWYDDGIRRGYLQQPLKRAYE